MTYTTTYTLESGPEDAPSCINVTQDYSFRFGTLDSWMEPGDPPEVELDGPASFTNEFGEEVEVSLVLRGEEGLFESILNNPPEPDEPDWDY